MVANCVEANPVLTELEPDVEALLVNRTNGAREYYRAPIDRCYALAGLIRTHWRGLSGGSEVWDAVSMQYFAELRERGHAAAGAETCGPWLTSISPSTGVTVERYAAIPPCCIRVARQQCHSGAGDRERDAELPDPDRTGAPALWRSPSTSGSPICSERPNAGARPCKAFSGPM